MKRFKQSRRHTGWRLSCFSPRAKQALILTRLCDQPCESVNGRLRGILLNGEIFYTLQEARILIENWRREYNEIRPHGSFGYRPAAPQTRTLIPAFAFAGGGRLD